MNVLPATLGASDEHYRRLGVSRDRIELWEDGMRTDGGKGTYEWWYFDAYLNDGSKLAITFRTKPIIDVGKALDPRIDFNLERADGTSVVKHLHIESEHFSAWLPSVPQGDAQVTIAVDGGNPQHYTGIGYHDHNWGNISMLKLMHDWYWARGKIANYSLIASYITAEQRYGSKTFPVFMLAKDGRVIADDGTKVHFSMRDVAIEPDTGKPVANQVIYEYTDGAERYVLTFTREKDTLHYKFLEELHGIKALLARLIRVDGAYLRFTGDLKFEHYQTDTLVETQQGESLWELMYFGLHAPPTGTWMLSQHPFSLCIRPAALHDLPRGAAALVSGFYSGSFSAVPGVPQRTFQQEAGAAIGSCALSRHRRWILHDPPLACMDEDQVNKLLDSLRLKRDKAMILLMFHGGLRPGEVLNLQLPDIQYGRRRVVVRYRTDHPKGVRTKSRTERIVDLLQPETLQAVSDYVMNERPTESESPYVFLVGGQGKRRCEPLGYHALVKLFERHCERLNIRNPWVTPHALRHTHATRMWEKGMRELTLQKRLGHASPEATRIYTQVSDPVMVAEYRRALGMEAPE